LSVKSLTQKLSHGTKEHYRLVGRSSLV